MNAPPVSSLSAAAPPGTVPVHQPALTVLVRAEDTRAVLAREQVRPDDLTDHIAEAWREGCLRRRFPGVALADHPLQVRPVRLDRHTSHCHGFALEASLPDGAIASTLFTVSSLRPVAERAADRLVTLSRLQSGQTYTYEIHFHAEREVRAERAPSAAEFEVHDRSPTLQWLEVPLRPLLEQATPRQQLEESAFHVFITAEAFARAERFGRQGEAANPPVETGAALLGVPCSCPETGDFFVVVTDAYEVTGAEQGVFSLNYTERSWNRIHAVLRARQTLTPALRLVGQAHGHNFLPAGGKTCEACPTRAVCDLTNLYASADDQDWTRAIFAGAPYALCLIFGRSARGDRVHGLFTQHDARLRQRGYRVLADFKLDPWECRRGASR